MSQHFGSYAQKSDAIACSECGQRGFIIWEDVPRATGNARELVKIEGDFYERLSNKPPYSIELVCNKCGASQTE